MSLLLEIQKSLLAEDDLGPILLKLRYLASRLGSDPLEEWVRHESEGYPSGTEVPEYRKVPVSYVADFSGPFGSGIRNAPIPPALIHKLAGEAWNNLEMRQSLSGIEAMLPRAKDGGEILHIDSANLILALHGKVYKDLACNSVTGHLPCAALVEIQNGVRSRVLELTIQLQKSVPQAAEIALGSLDAEPAIENKDAINQITQQIIYGNVTTISSSGDGARFLLNIGKGDDEALLNALVGGGIPQSDATELAEIIASEQPESKDSPFGRRAKEWLAEHIPKAVNGTWKVGMDVATKVLTEAALRYYGLK